MALFNKIVGNLLLALQVLILFLVIFYDYVEIPAWLQVAGRLHPLVLHLPIGFLLMLAFLQLFKREFRKKPFQRLELLMTALVAVVTSLTALMGIFLSREGGYEEASLYRHLNTGTVLSFLTWALYLIKFYRPDYQKLSYGTLGASSLLILITGHLGANLTHGENYLWQPLMAKENTVVVTDSTSLFAAAIHPLLEKKCISCHNEKKAKGELVMTTIEKIMAGGKHGPIWKAGQPDSSALLIRVHLPEENDDHMPPSGKPQLNGNEVLLIEKWIASGADFNKAWTTYSDTVRQLAASLLPGTAAIATTYAFDAADPATVEALNSPYLTVKPVASSSPALMADFYIGSQFQPQQLEQLVKVREQLVYLNLSGMPVIDAHVSTIRQFTNLEKLNLNNTQLTTQGVLALSSLQKLTSLSLNGLPLDKPTLEALGALPQLKSVYFWNTPVQEDDVASLRTAFPNVDWNRGYVVNEKLQLTPPLLVNESLLLGKEDKVLFKHNLPGVQIRYTLDGSEPDSTTSTVYEGPIALTDFTIVKARAVKSEWYSSKVISVPFFVSGIRPATVELLSKPDKDYRAEGAGTLINGKKGDPDNYRDNQWLGFRQNAAIILFGFDQPVALKKVTVGYNRNIPSYLMPPQSVELWAGNQKDQLKLIRTITPTQPRESEPTKALGLFLETDQKSYSFYKLVVNPVPKLPAWHSGKGEKGWVFLDEVIFNP